MKYGKLELISLERKDNWGKEYWLCRCDCGNEKVIRLGHIKQGKTISCGCHKSKLAKERATHGHSSGGKVSRTYASRRQMLQRCRTSTHKQYSGYGGRGISVCDRWIESFENFLEDMGECPYGFTIERIDNDGDYTPENCKWASYREQANNRRSSRIVEYEGERLTTAQWSRRTGIERCTIQWRLDNGWTIHDALFLTLEPNTFARHSERDINLSGKIK